jgi:hypothetical protein
LKKVDPRHTGHALVGEKKRDDVFALLQLTADVKRGYTGCGADDAVVLSVVPAQVLHNSLKYAGVVIDGEQNRLRHILFILA